MQPHMREIRLQKIKYAIVPLIHRECEDLHWMLETMNNTEPYINYSFPIHAYL